MERKKEMKCQTILALEGAPNSGIRSKELLDLVFKNGDTHVINEYVNSLVRETQEEIELNSRASSALIKVEGNGIILDLQSINQILIEPMREERSTLLEDSTLLGMKEEVGTYKWVQEVLRKNNYKSKSIKDFEEEVDSDDELLGLLKRVVKITKTIGIHERLKEVEVEGKIHTNFISYYGLSGRIISHSPSSQNFASEWKNYLLPIREGEKVWELDVISAEILAIARITGESKINKIMAERDFYKYVTSEMFDIEEDKVTYSQRKAMKRVVNAINYGIGGAGIAKIINESKIFKDELSDELGWQIKGAYFDLFPKVKEYQKKASEATELKTISGHKFKVKPSYKHISFSPQNMIAALMKDLLISLDEKNYTANIINIVHDSIWISSTREVAEEIKDVMEGVFAELVEGTEAEGVELIRLTELGGVKK